MIIAKVTKESYLKNAQ